MVKGGAPDSAKLVYITLKYLRSISLGFIVIINYIVFMGATNQQASLGGAQSCHVKVSHMGHVRFEMVGSTDIPGILNG